MTRYDLRTGQDLSLLMFIQSKCDMRKIFDPDSDPPDSPTEVCESERSEGLNITLVGLSQSEREQSKPPSLYSSGDFHLRQQILF
jgi:hypothetical protein